MANRRRTQDRVKSVFRRVTAAAPVPRGHSASTRPGVRAAASGSVAGGESAAGLFCVDGALAGGVAAGVSGTAGALVGFTGVTGAPGACGWLGGVAVPVGVDGALGFTLFGGVGAVGVAVPLWVGEAEGSSVAVAVGLAGLVGLVGLVGFGVALGVGVALGLAVALGFGVALGLSLDGGWWVGAGLGLGTIGVSSSGTTTSGLSCVSLEGFCSFAGAEGLLPFGALLALTVNRRESTMAWACPGFSGR